MVLFLIIGLTLNFLFGFICLILNFNFIYVIFMCLDAGTLAFLIPSYVTIKKDEKILEFWNMVGNMPSDMQKAILAESENVECAMCKRKMKKHEVECFHVDSQTNKLVCWCKKCNKKKYKFYTRH